MEESSLARLLEKYQSADRGWLWGNSLNCRDIDPDSTFGKDDLEKNGNLAVIFNAESFMLLQLQATEMTLASINEKQFTRGIWIFPKSRKCLRQRSQ